MNLSFLNFLPDIMLRGLGIYDRVQSDIQKRAAGKALAKAEAEGKKSAEATASDRAEIK